MKAPVAPTSDDEFGYDFESGDEELLIQLASNNALPLKQAPAAFGPGPAPSAAIKTNSSFEASQENKQSQRYALRSAAIPLSQVEPKEEPSSDKDLKQAFSSAPSVDGTVIYPDLTGALKAIESVQSPPPTEIIDDDDDGFEDERSPLQRFRSFPRRPLTVSDLTAGAWCELQYWYTLTRLPGGRKTRTPAMQQGSKVHKKLEDEVHTTVKIEILNKEDGFGLRLWNLVQGLRTLRDTGMTRELEVWGLVDGNLVNGVIDHLSYDNPNPEFEEELSSSRANESSLNQSFISDYFPPPKSGKTNGSNRQVFLTDVKTRGTLSPISPAVIRPAKIQLLLYHRLLSDMAAGKLDYFRVFRRYGLDPDERFSDTFMSQIGDLHDEIFFDTPTSSAEEHTDQPNNNTTKQHAPQTDPTTIDSSPGVPDLLKYGSLRELLTLVRDEINLTFPRGAASLGPILRVQYVFRDDGRELNAHDFPVSEQALDAYLAGDLGWWKGERRPRGVRIEEAFKCSSCEFAAGCRWRRDQDEERVKRTQERVNRAKQAVELRF